ncbi:MAG TPA: 1-acyl-sn-glycerol-3-phosphate acyltransferase [Candidatus Fimivicinus intestinavium]|nr:1-acyl-sn-glycerol-3-phosphate acyltransferase [Candidatus Fimivicinus intestinavium]
MRTIIWFLYFWGYLIAVLPKIHRAKKLTKAGKIAERDALVSQAVQKWSRRLLKLAGVKVVVHGLENIPTGACVFVSNHQGLFDIPTLLGYLDQPHGLIAKKEADKIPMIRTWMRYLGCIFLDRENARSAMESLREGVALLQKGYSITIFPEGTRSRGEAMGEFKNGAFKMAEKAQVPLVPVRISGTYRVMEANHMWIKPARVTLTVLPPLSTAGLSREERKGLGAAVREKIAAAAGTCEKNTSGLL